VFLGISLSGTHAFRCYQPDRCIDVERIELDPATDTACPFGGNQRGAAAQEGVDDDVAAVRSHPILGGLHHHYVRV
jgi:hypothetical protein